MTDTPYLTPGVQEASNGLVQQAAALLPMVKPALKYVPKNPLFLIGAVALGVAGVVAWRNREKIAATAGPVLQNAAAKTVELKDQALAKGSDLKDQVIAKGTDLKDQAVAKGAELREKLPFGHAEPAAAPPVH